ncbi:MAG: DUF3604 domain-containing protein [Proteobacteria bacterium]|nr:DUF3604 domain-containing protein [Pseudomonadota bacterium]MDA1302476.1 DUF3604 domain-containing protein [Pseudomonadota bacterium]
MTANFWGDTHLHTNLSGDAVFRLGPDAAYRCAKIVDPGSARLSEKARIIEWIEKIRRGGR